MIQMKWKMRPTYEYIRRQLNRLQDSLSVDIYEDGLRVYTTLNTQIQKYMEQAVDSTIDRIQERVRRQKPLKNSERQRYGFCISRNHNDANRICLL